VPVPRLWLDILLGPAFVINLNSRPDRLAASAGEIKRAGFTDVRRFPAVDATDPDGLAQAWANCGSPPFAAWDGGFEIVPGKQACLLSHLAVWQEIVDRDLPFACVFEDDVVFHRHWAHLAPTAFAFTPPEYDLLYMGNMTVTPGSGLVRKTPVYCTHAYLITREGAARVRSLLLADPEGVGSIDIMLFRHQSRWEADPQGSSFSWYAWSGTTFADKRAGVAVEWQNRNTGLVFQDFALGSDIAATATVT
jgi:hypothetical protein